MKRGPADCFCQKCGAQPEKPCRTPSGGTTKMHAKRGAAIHGSPKAMRLECWRMGWKHGSSNSSKQQAESAASHYLSPLDYLEGWRVANAVTEYEDEKARQRLMA